jgi:PAS domain S-box-containing protein
MIVRKPVNISLLIFSLALLFSIIASFTNEQITDNQIKAGYISNFIKYLSWENENNIDTFKIGIYGNDVEYITILKSLETLKAKNKPIQVNIFKTIAEITFSHLMVVTNDKNNDITDIYNLVKKENTLLVSDRCEYQRYITINFIYNQDSKVQFEINSRNLEEAGIVTSPKLILLGGSEIDVRKLYLETEKSLISEKDKVQSYEKELNQKKDEIQLMNTKLIQLYKSIDALQSRITSQKNELSSLTLQSANQKKDLDHKSIILLNQQSEIANREKLLNVRNKEIIEKQRKIDSYSTVLNKQKNDIDKTQKIIDKQELTLKSQGEILNKQIERIRTQQNFLYLLIALITVSFLLIYVVYYFYRINKRKNLELEKLSIVARETDNAVVIANEKFEFEWVNEGFNRFYGYNLEQFVSLKGRNLLQASTYPHILDVINQILSEKKSHTYESSTLNKEGETIWIHSTLTPILDENRNLKKLIIIDSDITQQKEAELAVLEKSEEIQRQSEELFEQTEQLMALNHELENKKGKLEEALTKIKKTQTQLVESEKMVILGQLTSGIAHEINNPINFINSGIEGIKMSFEQILVLLNKYENITETNANTVLPEIIAYKKEIDYHNLLNDIGQLTKDIKVGVFRTIEIIKGLRTFSRLDESDIKFIDIHQNIESTLIILRNKYNNRIEIVKDFGSVPEIECYPGKINQVILNILVNAIQSIANEGQINIKTRQIKKNKEPWIEIQIRDTGSGMTDEVKRKIFEPFYTTKDAGEGTGLGLSISFNIIENHHGFINVDSILGEGSTFTLTLPVNFAYKNKPITIVD